MTAALIAIVASLAVAGPARADSYIVTGTGDSVSPGGCESLGQGVWTCAFLRAAIDAANVNANADSIGLTVGTIVLQSPLSITQDVTISGGGARSTVIDGDGEVRAFTIGSGADVTLATMTIRDGANVPGNGGNIAVAPSATLSLLYGRVTNGTADRGAGIYNQGQVEIFFSLVDGNTAQTSAAASGTTAQPASRPNST